MYKNCSRYDLLNEFYQASGQWSKVKKTFKDTLMEAHALLLFRSSARFTNDLATSLSGGMEYMRIKYE